MLKGHRTMNVDAAPRHTWSSEDWDRIAAELQRLHTDWRTHQFTMDEFEDAMETVIAQEHHKAFPDMIEVMPHLFMAFARRSPATGKSTASPRTKTVPKLVTADGAIRWTPDEWEQVVLELHRLSPTMFEDRCAKLNFRDLRAAQTTLDFSRRREPNQIEIYRKQLLKTWDALPADVRDPRLQERKIVDFPSGPIMEPPKQRSDDSSAIALAMHKGFQAPAKPEAKPITLDKVKQKRNYYDATDWLNIAREMYRQNPHAPYLTSAFQTVDLPALRAAQSVVIPIERRRKILGNIGLANPLVAAFKALKLEQIELATERLESAEDTGVLSYNPGLQDEPEGIPTIEQTGLSGADEWPEEPAAQFVYSPPAKEIAAPAPVAVPSDFLSRIVAASKPLIGVLVAEFRQGIAEEVAKILLPQITGALTPMLEDSLQGVKDAIAAQFNPWKDVAQPLPIAAPPDYLRGAQAASVPNNPPSEQNMGILQAAQTLIAKPVEKPKKLKIAIIGPRGGQQEQVIRAFPEFDFTFIENGHGIKEAGAHCALFIASNAYLNRANRDSLKAHVSPEKVRFIDGGMSTIKRTINVWQATQTDKPPTL